ncbi:COMT methyltransferase, partial [Amia calva]|nr:COMT methyltransferase [Amia calva]
MNSTHGQPDSVLQTFDLYAQTQPSLSIGKEKGEFVDCVVHRVAPTCALELGTHCGYTAIRILRRLPSSAKLYTVEQDPATAEAGEEMILVAGFKHSQFQMLISPSSAAIPRMRAELGVRAVGLVLMDHDVEQYLPDLQALEQEGLVSTGSVLLVNNTHAQGARDFLRYIHSNPRYSVHSQRHGMLEVQCQQGSIDGTR